MPADHIRSSQNVDAEHLELIEIANALCLALVGIGKLRLSLMPARSRGTQRRPLIAEVWRWLRRIVSTEHVSKIGQC